MAESLQGPDDVSLLNSAAAPDGCAPLLAGQLDRSAIATAEDIHRTCLKSIQSELSELLQLQALANSSGTTQGRLVDELDLASPDYRTIQLDLSPLRSFAYLTFPSSLLFNVLDILLASPGSTTQDEMPGQPPRSVTGIELYILREFFEIFAKSLRTAWAPVYPAAFTQRPPIPDDDTLPDAEAADEFALILSSNIEFGGQTAEVRLLLPTFLPRIAQMKPGDASGRNGSEPVGGIIRCLSGALVNVDAVLQGASIRIQDIFAMAPGQILTIASTSPSQFQGLVNGRTQFTGTLVSNGGQCSLRVDSLAEQTESYPQSGPWPER